MNRLRWRLVLSASLFAASACSSKKATPAPAAPTASLSLSAAPASVANDGSQAQILVTAQDQAGNPGGGAMTLVADHGSLNGGGSSAIATVANGSATVTFACDVSKDAKCLPGSIHIVGSWQGLSADTKVAVTGNAPPEPDGGNPLGDGGIPPPVDGGVADAGPSLQGTTLTVGTIFPNHLVTATSADPDAGLPGQATLAFVAKLADGSPAAGYPVTFSETVGEGLLSLNPLAPTTDSTGSISVQATSLNQPGVAHVNAVLGTGAATATAAIAILGGPTSIDWQSATPDVLGIQSSGIQVHGQMSFKVTDQLGNPVPSVPVSFTQTQPQILDIPTASGVSDNAGMVTVFYNSRDEVGVAQVVATVSATGAAASHAVGVRAAKPSASGFYFSCDRGNLPVYTTRRGYETMTCTVRLKDRYGNRVGVPTPVYFATEAGAISASVMTKGFDPANPTDPDEGSATVIFSTDTAVGGFPPNVNPLPADPNQYPVPRPAEPRVTSGQLTFNPRSRLIEIVAMTQGEEAFVDENHNNMHDSNEVFIDQGDPFIDANDDNVYDTVTPTGQWETRFCGTSTVSGPDGGSACPAYQGPNGVWNDNTIIWKPFWVVFSGAPFPTTTPPGGAPPASDFAPSCANYIDSGGVSIITSDIYAYDAYLNRGASGTTYGAAFVGTPALTLSTVGFSTELDNLGSIDMGVTLVAESDGGVCGSQNGVACVDKTFFAGWDDGFIGDLIVSNQTKTPQLDGGAIPPTWSCPGGPVFDVDVKATTAGATPATADGIASGRHAINPQ